MLKFRPSKKSEDIEPHEIILDNLAKNKEAEMGLTEKKLEVPLLKKILQGFFFFSCLIILVLFAKTFQLQMIEGKTFSQLAEENKFIIYKIQAERGIIYDKDLNQLVSNSPSFDLICDDEIITRNLDHQSLILYETKIDKMPGCEIKNSSVRDYQEGTLFSHLIGYTGKIKKEEFEESPDVYSINDYVGRTGIENYYEDILRKNPGKLRIERDALGNIISQEVVSLSESGQSLVLWLDSDLQRKITEELEKVLVNIGSQKAVGVALDPKTGGVLSLVSLPGFDNNLFQKGADQEKLGNLLKDPYDLEPLFNRAVSGRYLTGSVIKPLIASAALEENLIDPDESLYCEGSISIPNPWDPTASTTKKDWTSHGWTNMREAIAESCNVYFYTIGGGFNQQEGLGPTKIKEYLQLFGWSDKTGIDLTGEAEGFIPDKEWKKKVWGEGWWDGDTYNLAIGQGFLQITPLEVVSSFTAIANGGKLFQPQIVQKIINSQKETVEEFEPEIIRQDFINPQNLEIVRQGMRWAVSGENSPQASSILLNSLPIQAAAKTGTAELGKNHYHNWITVFAPYEDPEIVLTLMVEGVEGVQAAVLPVARNVLEWYFTKEAE